MNQSLRFDKKDRDLLVKINEVIDSGNVSSAEQETFRTSLHPHGIQNMVSTHEERMAMAEVNDNVPVPLRQTSEDEENQKLTRLEIKA